MMLFSMPPYEIGTINDLSVSRADHDRARMQLGRAELRAAARVLRQLWGGPAARLVVELNRDEDGDTQINALALFHAKGQLIWFNQQTDAGEHPGAADISDDKGVPRTSMDNEVVSAIELHIGAAYAAMDGTGLALEAVTDRRLGSPDSNLLELDLDGALMSDDAPQRRMALVMDTITKIARRDLYFGGREATDEILWAMAHDLDADLFPGRLDERQANYETPEDGDYDNDWIDQLRAAYDKGLRFVHPPVVTV